MHFADYLVQSMEKRQSILCAGLDLRADSIPKCFVGSSSDDDENIEQTITDYYFAALEVLAPHAACVKPNAAFFEQYGIGGQKALQRICDRARELALPIILDAKRGDIGSTNEGYARAYLSSTSLFERTPTTIQPDALTVNAFLGLDSATPFVNAAAESGRGVFDVNNKTAVGKCTLVQNKQLF